LFNTPLTHAKMFNASKSSLTYVGAKSLRQ
jgi:hypothetical protein